MKKKGQLCCPFFVLAYLYKTRTMEFFMSKKDIEIFEGKSLSGLLEDIYNNSTKTKKQIDILTEELSKFVKRVSDVPVISPIIKEYLDVSIKNDEQLVKIAQVITRLQSKATTDDSAVLTDKEKAQLLEALNEEVKDIQFDMDTVTNKHKTLEN